MKLFKFFGQTSRAVLEQVRTELGPDAMIVSNRPTANGIEITAVAAEAFAAIEAAPAAAASQRRAAFRRFGAARIAAPAEAVRVRVRRAGTAAGSNRPHRRERVQPPGDGRDAGHARAHRRPVRATGLE